MEEKEEEEETTDRNPRKNEEDEEKGYRYQRNPRNIAPKDRSGKIQLASFQIIRAYIYYCCCFHRGNGEK